MLRSLLSISLLLILSAASAQSIVVHTDDMETTLYWSFSSASTANNWVLNTCAGNTAPPATGSNALYITSGTNSVCSASDYNYANAPSGTTETALAYTIIKGDCANSMVVSFDYKFQGVSGEDTVQLVYSTDLGVTWNAVATLPAIGNVWTAVTYNLPSTLNTSQFLLGFRFTYNDSNIGGVPPAIDNLEVDGTDLTPPVIVCPSTVNQPVNASCIAIADVYKPFLVNLSDNCTDSVNLTVTQSITAGSTISLPTGSSTTLTMTAIDEAGNSSQCTFTLQIIDTISPVITGCPANDTLYVDSNCVSIIPDYLSVVSGADNCSAVTWTQLPATGDTLSGNGTVSNLLIIATDSSGNVSTCQFTMTAIDTILPQILCPLSQTIYANSNCEALLGDYTSLVTITENCTPLSAMTVVQSPTPGTTVSADQVVTINLYNGTPTAPVYCQIDVLFIDTIKPSVICPLQNTIYLNGSCQAVVPSYTGSAVVSDNCSSGSLLVVTQTPTAGTLIDTTQVIYITATDNYGNFSSCPVYQQVIDTTSPVLTCPGPQTLYAGTNCNAVLTDYTSMVTSSENCMFAQSVTYSQFPVSGTTVSGTSIITITGTDEASNTGTCSFSVQVIDTVSPVITCPLATTVSVGASCQYSMVNFTSQVTATDNCAAASSLTYTQTPASGIQLSQGTQNVTIQVTDPSGNSNSCVFVLTVTDQVNPTITCPSTQTDTVDANCQALLNDYTSLVSIADNCSTTAQMTLVQSPSAGTTINANTSVSMTVTDELGNSATCSFTVTTIDTIHPVITCPDTVLVSINSSCQYLVPDLSGQVTATDNCNTLSTMVYLQNPSTGTTQTGTSVVLVTVADQHGNQAGCTTTLMPIDTTAPVITCPSPAIVDIGNNCDYVLPNYGTTTLVLDNCSGFTIAQVPVPGTVVTTGSSVIQMTATDIGGNTASCSFILIVHDNEDPVITCPGNISTCDPVVTFNAPVYSDNCISILEQISAQNYQSGDTFPTGITTLTYQVSDSSGNTATCSFTVEILDLPSEAHILDDTISLCQTSSAVIEADPATGGTGIWSVLSGAGNFNNQYASTTGINNLGYGQTVLTWTISTSSCGSDSDTLVIINSQAPSQATTQDTVYSCYLNSVNLVANPPQYGTGIWSSLQNASITDSDSPNTYATNLQGGWNEFIWTISNGSCPSSSDTVRYYSTAGIQILEQDTSLCVDQNSIILHAAPYNGAEMPDWLLVSGGGDLTNETISSVQVSNLENGVNTILYRLTSAHCPPYADTIRIIVASCAGTDLVFPTVITPNYDGKNDLFVIDNLELLYPNCEVLIFNRWGSVVFESTGYQDPWDGKFKGEPLPLGTYFYKIKLNDGGGTEYKGSISIIQ